MLGGLGLGLGLGLIRLGTLLRAQHYSWMLKPFGTVTTPYIIIMDRIIIINYSSWGDVTCGIPQGSVLGPMLFICYINDMPSSVLSSIYLFADDAKLYRNIASDDDPHSSTTFSNWTNGQRNGRALRFNSNKCKVMHLGRQNPRQNYTMGGTTLATTTSEKDLGVYVDTELTFEKHIKTCKPGQQNARTHPSLVYLPRQPVTAETVFQSCQAEARVYKCSMDSYPETRPNPK